MLNMSLEVISGYTEDLMVRWSIKGLKTRLVVFKHECGVNVLWHNKVLSGRRKCVMVQVSV